MDFLATCCSFPPSLRLGAYGFTEEFYAMPCVPLTKRHHASVVWPSGSMSLGPLWATTHFDPEACVLEERARDLDLRLQSRQMLKETPLTQKKGPDSGFTSDGPLPRR